MAGSVLEELRVLETLAQNDYLDTTQMEQSLLVSPHEEMGSEQGLRNETTETQLVVMGEVPTVHQ